VGRGSEHGPAAGRAEKETGGGAGGGGSRVAAS